LLPPTTAASCLQAIACQTTQLPQLPAVHMLFKRSISFGQQRNFLPPAFHNT
jgi:hypothetical protein